MDVQFPLRYSQGSLKLVEGVEERFSNGRFLLSTIRSERYLYPRFGLDYGILFQPEFPAAVLQDVETALEQLPDLDSDAKITDEGGGVVELEVTLRSGSRTSTIRRPFPG